MKRLEKNAIEMAGIAVGIEVVCTAFAGIVVAGTEVEVQLARIGGTGNWQKGDVLDLCCCILGLRRCGGLLCIGRRLLDRRLMHSWDCR